MEGYRPETQENIGMKEKYQEIFENIKDIPINQAREIVAMSYDLRPVAEMDVDVSADEEKDIMERIELFKRAGFFVESYEH